MPPSAPTPSATRIRLGAEALRRFLDQGFAATPVREIATAAGVTVPAIYYHFGSKDGLLGALVEPLIEDGERVISELVAVGPDMDAGRALAFYYDVMTAHLDVFRLVMVDPSVRSHNVAGHRLAEQGNRFLGILTGGSTDHGAVLRANAALGALRRPLRLDDVDVVADRAQILACAESALSARPATGQGPPTRP